MFGSVARGEADRQSDIASSSSSMATERVPDGAQQTWSVS
ncbi:MULTISPECIES: hypothetical protein [Haladaptatus]|nr:MULTISPECIES: hypothetical protein [Haladaptatus]